MPLRKFIASSSAATALVAISAALFAASLLQACRKQPNPSPQSTQAFADPATCLQCHADAAAGYARTGMAHAFYQPHATDATAPNSSQATFHHTASDTFYSMTQHEGRLFQRRWQTGYNGATDNVEELQVDYVMGSGNHVKTYLHRNPDGTLIELPAAWYAEAGGHLAMNPGYDNPSPATHQVIAYECMFCHNGYPEIPAQSVAGHRDPELPVFTGNMPEGIDCQRCHGPGQQHVDAARRPGATLQQISAAILNPKRLPPARQMEVCEQCHLETTSRRLPDRLRRYDREPFSYASNQPLEAFNAYFERDGAHGNTANFEIVSSSYRLRQSRCFRETQGALTCETCHNPHDLQKGPAAAGYYAAICMRCHAPGLPAQIAVKNHPTSNDCTTCHMPKRRTEDVVHVVMTDHLIQRRPPPAPVLLAARAELPPGDAYHGEVKRYLLSSNQLPDDALYDATAQVANSSNLAAGIPLLADAIRTQHPARPEFAIQLGDAQRRSGNLQAAVDAFRQALAADPESITALRDLAVALAESGNPAEALSTLDRALAAAPDNPRLWYEKGRIESQQGDSTRAIADLRKALALKPDLAAAQVNLGIALAQSADAAGAETAFRAALTINPYVAATRANLGRLLAGNGDLPQAAFQLQKATSLDPSLAAAHSDYATVLAQLHHMPEATRQAELAVKAAPHSAAAHDLLGEFLAQARQMPRAAAEFAQAVQLDPNLAPAQMDLALALLNRGDRQGGIEHLQLAARSSGETALRARELLHQLGAP